MAQATAIGRRGEAVRGGTAPGRSTRSGGSRRSRRAAGPVKPSPVQRQMLQAAEATFSASVSGAQGGGATRAHAWALRCSTERRRRSRRAFALRPARIGGSLWRARRGHVAEDEEPFLGDGGRPPGGWRRRGRRRRELPLRQVEASGLVQEQPTQPGDAPPRVGEELLDADDGVRPGIAAAAIPEEPIGLVPPASAVSTGPGVAPAASAATARPSRTTWINRIGPSYRPDPVQDRVGQHAQHGPRLGRHRRPRRPRGRGGPASGPTAGGPRPGSRAPRRPSRWAPIPVAKPLSATISSAARRRAATGSDTRCNMKASGRSSSPRPATTSSGWACRVSATRRASEPGWPTTRNTVQPNS